MSRTSTLAAKTKPTSVWLDRFFDFYYRRRPVNATFIGIHDWDHELPDFSQAAVADTQSEVSDLLSTAPAPELADSFSDRIDVRLATGFLRIQEWELESFHFQRGNPSTYTGEAIFGVVSLFLTSYAPLPQRVSSCIKRLNAFPEFFETASVNLRSAPAVWTLKAQRECRAGMALIARGLDLIQGVAEIGGLSLERARTRSLRAIEAFQGFLVKELLPQSKGRFTCGEEALTLYLREGHFLAESAEDVLRYAEHEMGRAQDQLLASSKERGYSSPGEALSALAQIHPSQQEYLDRYTTTWEQVRTLALHKELLTWPEFPIRYVPRPRWVREAAPDLYFLFYRSPAAHNRPEVHDYLVTPIDQELPDERMIQLLRANNDSVIKLNHVIHHGSIGHHVQNWHAFRSRSRIGRIAAVDCASRIALFCGGTMAEGWACYATDLVREAGYLTPLEELAELRSRTRMCARAIVDVQLHSGRMSFAEAQRFYLDHAGMSAEAAQSEAVKNSMFPGTALMYLMGTDQIHSLRNEISTRQGSAFSLKRFHDEFLSYGSIPVSLIAAHMQDLSEIDRGV